MLFHQARASSSSSSSMLIASILLLSSSAWTTFNNGFVSAFTPTTTRRTSYSLLPSSVVSTKNTKTTYLQSTVDDDGPSDYDPQDILPSQKQLTVDTAEGDAIIRDELKRELLLLSSITNRGQFATSDEKNIIIDIVTQLEALNPTPDPASLTETVGEWDLCLTSTQAFRSSPFFQSIRAIFGDDGSNGSSSSTSTSSSSSTASVAENAFNLHDLATSVGKVGRVRQSIQDDGMFTSEVDIEVGLMGGLPLVIKGTVVTTAEYKVTGPEAWDLTVKNTQVKKSNVPFLDQLLDDYPVEVPVGEVYERLRGSIPVAKLKTFYVDEAMRITRDQDDNFYVFCRA